MRNNPNSHWVLIAVGLMFVCAGLYSLWSGRTVGSYRNRWGGTRDYEVDSVNAPIQFLIHVGLALLVGGALIFFGVKKLLAL
jgi:hypothetical protein